MKQLVKSLAYILSLSLIVFLLPINQAHAAPTYIYEWVSQSGIVSDDGLAHEYTNLEPGQTLNLSLTLFNRSGNTIQSRYRLGNSPGKQVPVGSYGIGSQTPKQDGTPHFLDLSSFILNNNRFAYYEGEDVPDNGLITMNWNIKLNNNLTDGVYNLYVRPVSEYLAWTRQIKNGKLLPTTSSDIFWRLTVGEKSCIFDTSVNLSSIYCDVLGYKREGVEKPAGQSEICIFPDKSECEAWSFFTGECGQEWSYCRRLGYGSKSTGSQKWTRGAICITDNGEEIGYVIDLFCGR